MREQWGRDECRSCAAVTNQSRRRPSPDAAVVFLKRKGVRVMAGPVLIQAGVRAGMKVDYFLGRLGNQLEFVQF